MSATNLNPKLRRSPSEGMQLTCILVASLGLCNLTPTPMMNWCASHFFFSKLDHKYSQILRPYTHTSQKSNQLSMLI